jgi:exopolysaccharide biosynthesis polyprenyl glycosylphosphotransferase
VIRNDSSEVRVAPEAASSVGNKSPAAVAGPIVMPDPVPSKRRRLRSLSLDFSERKLLLAVVDTLLVNAALFATLLLRSDYMPELVPSEQSVSWFVVLSIVWMSVALFMDVYSLTRAADPLNAVRTTTVAALLACGIYLLIPYVTPTLPSTRLGVLVFVSLTVAGIVVWRLLYAAVFVQPNFHLRALIIGAGWSGRALAQAMRQMSGKDGHTYLGTGYQLLGFVDDDEQKQGIEVDRVPVLGTRRDLSRLARELRPDEIILAITNSQTIRDELFQAILECSEIGIRITTMPALYETITGRVPIDHAGQDLTVVLPLRQSATHRFYLVLRRLLDAVLGVIGLAFLLAVAAPLVWLANRMLAPGPLFYSQERVGEGGRSLRVVKFRSMISNAERDTGAVWAQENDVRVTAIGRVLRRTRLDELPQSWNLLKGDMTVIGPRPERPEFVHWLAAEVPFYRLRHAVKPGLSGWAQINYPYGASLHDAQIKLQYDLYYIKHQGLLLDLVIAFKTIQVILGLQGR